MARTRSILLLASLFLVSTTAFAAGIPIRGRVLDAAGAPLAKARVRLVPILSAHAAGRLELEGKADPEAVATVESGADGMFRLDAPEPGMWTVIAGGEGLVPQMTQVIPLLAEIDLPAVRLQRDTGLTVRVTGPDGKPVPGARVRTQASSRLKARFDSWQDVPGLAVTDAEGKAVLPRASGALTVRAGRSGVIAERKEVRTGTLELRLDAGQDIPVRVLGADGKPAANVLVAREDWMIGVTDAGGLLTLTAPGRSPLDVLLRGVDGSFLLARVHPFSAREKPGARELRLPAAVEVPTRVVSARDGRPVAGALVWLGTDPGGFRRTDGRGETRLALLLTYEGFVEAAAPGFLPDLHERKRTSGQRPATFSLQPDLAMTGLVVDEAGRPVAGAEITLDVKTRPQGGLSFTSMKRIFRIRGSVVRSGPDGRFRLGGLVGGIEYELRVKKAGFAPARAAATPPAPDRPAAPLRVVLQRGRSAFGRVLGPDRRPIAGAQVTLRTAVPTGPDRFRAAFDPENLDTFEAVTGGDGRFDLLHLPAGRYDLTARGRGWAPLTVPTLEIPEEDRATDLGTLVLAPGVALEGTVVNAAGRPVEGAAVHVTEAVDSSFPIPLALGGEEPAGVSGLDGFFRIEDLRAGSAVNVSVLRAGYTAGEARAVQVPAERPVRIVLQEVGAISGRVVDPDGKPIAGADVRIDFRPVGRLMRFTGALLYDESDLEGNFRLTEVTPGLIDLSAQAPGWQAGRVADLEVRGGEEKRGVEIMLSPAAILEGRVLTPSGEALPGAQVGLPFEEGQGRGFQMATTDDEGRYMLESLPPGHRTLEATHPDYGTARRQTELRVGENSLDITLEGGSEVSGRVVDDTGMPVPGAQVWLYSLGGPRPLSTMSQSDGSFRFAAVAAGDYRAGVDKEGFARSERVPVTVSGSSVSGLELRLSRGGALVGRITGVEPAELSRVQVVAWGRGMPVGGRVEPDGSYRIDRMTEGEWRVRAELPGTPLYAEGTVRLEPGAAEARLDLEMERGLELSVRVRRNGAPVPGETLFLEGPARRRAIGETDVDGRHRFSGLAAGSYRVQLEDPSGGPGQEERVDLQTDREILIDLQTGEVTGRVVDAADASPLANATVELLGGDSGSVPRPVRTDSRGVFVVRGVGEGSWRLRAQADGYAPAEAAVQVDGSGSAEEVELSLRATEGVTLQAMTAAGPPPRTLFYVVLDGAGRKVGNGTVAVGEAGRARLSRVPPGSWQVLLLSEATAPLEIAVTSPGDAGRLTLPPPCTLRVRVPALADSPVPATVILLGPGGRPFRTFARMGEVAAEWNLSRGTASWSDIPPGTWEVRVTAADGRTWRATVTTRPGVEAEAVVE